jgi:hypothetical protein
VAHEARVAPHPCQVHLLGHGFVWHFCLSWHPAANSELVWIKGHDKRGVGITQESHKKLWYELPVGGQGHSKHREGKAEERKTKAVGPGRECV